MPVRNPLLQNGITLPNSKYLMNGSRKLQFIFSCFETGNFKYDEIRRGENLKISKCTRNKDLLIKFIKI